MVDSSLLLWVGAPDGNAFSVRDWIGLFRQWGPLRVLGQGHDHKRRDDTAPLLMEPGAEFLLGHPESSSLYLKEQWDCWGLGIGDWVHLCGPRGQPGPTTS